MFVADKYFFMGKKRIKLVDIAKELDVSIGLVSIVLNGKAKENRIGDVMANKVIKKAEELGYRGNQFARGLKTGKSGIIGLLVADIANPYFGRMARYIENEASKLGYQVMFGSSDENALKLNELMNVFSARQVDGMIVVPVNKSEDFLERFQEQATPLVFIDRYVDGLDEDFVCTDNFQGAFALSNMLIEKGIKKIAAFVYNTEVTNNRDRIKGYTEALKKGNMFDPELVYMVGYKAMEESLREAIHEAVEKGCEALFFANNSLGETSLKILSELKLKIPEQIAVVSFDNPDTFQILPPGITCFEQPMEQICHNAVKTLIGKIENREKRKAINLMLEGNLIIRNSC